MSTLKSIAGKSSSCSEAQANTGKKGCLQEFGTPLSAIIVSKGYSIPSTQELTQTFINEQIQKGLMIPLMEASSFEDQSSDDAYSTNAAGVERLNLKGLPKYKLMFEEGHEFYREMANLESFKSKDIILIDDEGNWAMSVNSDGSYGGFSAGQITPEMRSTKVQGGDAESKSLVIQFTDRYQWDVAYEIFDRSQLGLDLDSIQGVNGVDISFVAVPAASDTDLTVSVLLSADKATPVLGMETSDFYVAVNGTESSITAAAVVGKDGQYTLSGVTLVASDVVTVQTLDASLNSTAINIDEDLFRSDISSETVVA